MTSEVLSKKLNDIHFINLPSLVKSCYMSRLTRCLHSFITVVSFVLSLTTHIHNISLAIARDILLKFTSNA